MLKNRDVINRVPVRFQDAIKNFMNWNDVYHEIKR